MSGSVSAQCSSSNHGQCPGYYMTATICECACHKARKQAAHPGTAELLAKLHADTRIPPAELVQQVNKGSFTADAVGHADTTDLLLAHDPAWSWEPFSTDEKGQPYVMYDQAGRPRAMWIRLTVHGHTRPGVGTCTADAKDPYKELIGDAIRNAAMRFGVALQLWSKSEWSDAGVETQGEGPTGGSAAPHPGRANSEPVLPKDQALAMRAAQLGLDDDTRGDVILAITKGKTRSGKDLNAQQVEWVVQAMEDLNAGLVELRYDEDGNPRIGRNAMVPAEATGAADDPF